MTEKQKKKGKRSTSLREYYIQITLQEYKVIFFILLLRRFALPLGSSGVRI